MSLRFRESVDFVSKETRKFMAKVRRMMTRWERLECSHCGHDELIEKAVYARLDLEQFIEGEYEKLFNSKGAP